MSPIENHIRPCLTRGVRLQWDDIRQQHALLLPEGMLVLNPTAVAVLELCDGRRTVSAIVAELEERYQNAALEKDVHHLLSRLVERGLLVNDEASIPTLIPKRTEERQIQAQPQGSGMDRPLSLIAELTYRCPLRCPYCSNPLDCGSDRYRQELTTEDWLRVIQQAQALGVLQFGFTGGEPLLRQDLEGLVEAAAKAKLYTTLVTAGTLFTPERATRLRDYGLDHVQISIQDSRAEESDRIAGMRSFEQKLEAARLAKALGFPLTLNFVLHRHNLDRIEEILELCETLEADRVELANTQYYGWAMHNRATLLPKREQLQRAEHAVAAFRKRQGQRMRILYIIPDYYENDPKPCMGGWGNRAMVIAPNGDVLPCQVASSIPGMDFANIRDRPLESIWFESEAFNRFRGTDWMSEPCRSCSRQAIDFGGCRCQALLLAGDVNATDPVCYLSPHHHLIIEAREQAQLEQLPSFVYRSMQDTLART